MIYFNCDYNEGAHERILARLAETNMEQTPGYGTDEYCEQARATIRRLCENDTLDVHFLVGGTQTNTTVIAAALRPHQGAVAAVSGHINGHETGAIEACGHKVLALPTEDGKITAEQVKKLYQDHVENGAFEHMVQPGLVYISNPTELGTLYSKAELEALSAVCRECGLYLFLDGARLAYGLCAEGNDLDLPTIARLCDVFYIGGTKVGALFGEAVVISNPALKKDFRYLIKQRGGMLAKGRLLGIQFQTLLEDGLYFELGKHADGLADEIRAACHEAGYPLLVEGTTNQIFVVLPDEKLAELQKEFAFEYYERVDESHSAVRFCTSWATKKEDVRRLAEAIARERMRL